MTAVAENSVMATAAIAMQDEVLLLTAVYALLCDFVTIVDVVNAAIGTAVAATQHDGAADIISLLSLLLIVNFCCNCC